MTLDRVTKVPEIVPDDGGSPEYLKYSNEQRDTDRRSYYTAQPGKCTTHKRTPYLPAGAMENVNVIKDERVFHGFT
ncbi:MAG TPA: hypothetical protein VMS08_00665 [Candidatus Saccharimonadia bacterium]|nr:hypothetical protein [Candidatus Saccharimonadia bacterium]